MSPIDEVTVNQAIYDYAWEKHRETLERYMDDWEDEFPEKDAGHPPEMTYKDYFAWIMFEKELPGTGKTLAELFADDNPGLSEGMKENLYRMRMVIRSEFKILDSDGKYWELEDKASKKIYRVKMIEKMPQTIGTVIRGRIQPFDNHYRLTGISLVEMPPWLPNINNLLGFYEDRRLEELEDITLRKGTALRTVLNKYPAQWIDHMCKHYGLKARLKKEKVEMIVKKLVSDLPEIVSELQEESKEVLALCMSNGGVLKYGKLRDYDDEFNFFWERNRSSSTVGILRMRALLLVGKMHFGERRYRVAYVPNEIRDRLMTLPCSGKTTLYEY